MTEQLERIKKIEDKYGLVLFRMALTCLLDNGRLYFTEANIKESINSMNAAAQENKAKGIRPIIGSEFQNNIVYCAAELAEFSAVELFTYIKKYVYISDTHDHK